MKCVKCKKKIPEKSKFCNFCGAKQKKEKFYRRKDGLYEKIMMIDGKRVAFRSKTEEGVFEKIRNYEERQSTGPMFVEVAEAWYDEHWETLSPTTQRGYKPAYEEIKEYFEDDYIREITHKKVNQYIKQLPKSYARKTCLTRLMIINMIYKFAVTEDIIEDNPCQYITIPKGHKQTKRRAPTSDEIMTIKMNVGFVHNDFPIGLMAVFLLYTGCRKGEALALQYKDIDRKKARINIYKSVYYISNNPAIKEPKSEAGIREVIIPSFLLNILPKGKPNDYIFSPAANKLAKQHHFEKAWAAFQKETGLNLTAHQLRHGYATLLHEADIDVKDAQELLGHADASTTQNIYTEVSSVRKSAVQQRLNEYLN